MDWQVKSLTVSLIFVCLFFCLFLFILGLKLYTEVFISLFFFKQIAKSVKVKLIMPGNLEMKFGM